MQFHTVLMYVLAAASVGFVAATPTAGEIAIAHPADDSTALNKRSGCGSSGPLGDGHYEWYINVSCSPGATMCVLASSIV